MVLSNNDGCVIARSAEAKPSDQNGYAVVSDEKRKIPGKTYAFSSNYELYASMSARVMSCTGGTGSGVEQYSIDEMFLDLDRCGALHGPGRTSAGSCDSMVYDCTRLTIGVGAGPTKTLAKSAQWASKEWKQFRGVLALTRGNPQRTRETAFTAAGRRDLGRGKPYCTQAQCSGHQNRARSGPDEPGLYPQKFLRSP